MANISYNNQFRNPAKFRNLLNFEELRKTQDNEGNWTEEWTASELGTTYAQIRNIRGNEYILAGAHQVKVSGRVNIRYRKDVEERYYELGEKLRLKFKNRIFNIEYVNNLEEKNTELEILVNEVR